MKKANLWLGLILLALSGLACAQGSGLKNITPPSPAHALSCLQRPSTPPKYPEHGKLDRVGGMMRVLLRFEKPDEKPHFEVLANTAREDMQDLVFRALAAYRLPCLTPQDGRVTAVQEFSFSNSDIDPMPIADEASQRPLCIVRPRNDLSLAMTGKNTAHAVVAMVFDGDGEKSPQVKIIHSSNMGPFDEDVLEFASKYRAPCRTAGDEPWIAQQVFMLVPEGVSTYKLKRESIGLMEFLGLTEGAQQLEADFDFRTMSCPFKVNYQVYGPELPNEVLLTDAPDPNRAIFIKWLSERQLHFANAKQANDLFGSTLQINVPCGVLSLHPQGAAASASGG